MPRRPAPVRPVDTSHDTAFRTAERYWKNKRDEREWARALTVDAIEWQTGEDGQRTINGIWRHHDNSIECTRILLDDMSNVGLGQTRWKGKAKAQESDYAIIVPKIPGNLRSSAAPNVTSLSAHYVLPAEGIWTYYERGQLDTVVERKDTPREIILKREPNNFEPVTGDNWTRVKDRGKPAEPLIQHSNTSSPALSENGEAEVRRDATVGELLPRLRWTTIGWTYDWTSKTYDFDSPQTHLPPLVHKCCRAVVRALPWDRVFSFSNDEDEDWINWKTHYEPDAGIINFYHLQDSLTAHVDQSEVDAVKPLVSFSIGHSAVFLVGGPTRDVEPLAIRLDSGDGLIMSGKRGRRIFHGLPRVIPNTLPEYLRSTTESDEADTWRGFGEYLEQGVRININVRTVF
ncbi:hypothetical protein OIV83_001613 [Microbotryomycetes sp. JL201]|nr:hypothetical protein OIV83_001613 [Microbotryomycetes sp. JL201]